jgi:tetratricopeptide (TPR) repeat protein
MLRKDYILRMIEMMVEVIAGIMGLIKKGEFDKASKSINNAYFQLLSEDATFFQKIPNDDLTDTLLNEHNYEDGHLEVLSELFRAQGELYFAQGQYSDSREYYQKSLTLLDYVTKNSGTFSFEKEMKVDELKNKIEELN